MHVWARAWVAARSGMADPVVLNPVAAVIVDQFMFNEIFCNKKAISLPEPCYLIGRAECDLSVKPGKIVLWKMAFKRFKEFWVDSMDPIRCVFWP